MNAPSATQADAAPRSEFLQPCHISILDSPPHAPESMQPIERLWYEVYVDEMGRFRDRADHERRQLADEHAQSDGVIVAARTNDSEVVGTVICYAHQHIGAFYTDLYAIPAEVTGEGVSMSSRLIVKKTFRQRSSLSVGLANAIFRWGRSSMIRWNFLDSNDYLVHYYQRLGYREHRGWIRHPTVGRVYSMVLDLHDEAYLRSIRSPFMQVLDGRA
jgi:hypothetical protein